MSAYGHASRTLSKPRELSKIRHQSREPDVEGDGETTEDIQAGIPPATFDFGYVRPMKLRALSELLLREPSFLAQDAHPPSKGWPKILHRPES